MFQFYLRSHLHRHTFSNKVVSSTPCYSSYDIAVHKIEVFTSSSVMFLQLFIEFPTLLYNMTDKLIVKSNIRNKIKYPQIFSKIFMISYLHMTEYNHTVSFTLPSEEPFSY